MGLKVANLNAYAADLKKHKSDYNKLKRWLKAPGTKADILAALASKNSIRMKDTCDMYDGQVWFELGLDPKKNEAFATIKPTAKFEYTLSYKADNTEDAKAKLQQVIDKSIWWVDNVVFNVISK